jgi:quinol monooxygenase YgiN
MTAGVIGANIAAGMVVISDLRRSGRYGSVPPPAAADARDGSEYPWQGPMKNIMAIRHVVTVQVADGRAEDFIDAIKALQESALRVPGCEQYELFRSVDDPDTIVMLERWSTRELLDRHMAAESASTPPWWTLVLGWGAHHGGVEERPWWGARGSLPYYDRCVAPGDIRISRIVCSDLQVQCGR